MSLLISKQIECKDIAHLFILNASVCADIYVQRSQETSVKFKRKYLQTRENYNYFSGKKTISMGYD